MTILSTLSDDSIDIATLRKSDNSIGRVTILSTLTFLSTLSDIYVDRFIFLSTLSDDSTLESKLTLSIKDGQDKSNVTN